MIEIRKLGNTFSFLSDSEHHLYSRILKDSLHFHFCFFDAKKKRHFFGNIFIPYHIEKKVTWSFTEKEEDTTKHYTIIESTPQWFSSLYFLSDKKLNDVTRLKKMFNLKGENNYDTI